MEEILNHFQTLIAAIQHNEGTQQEPALVDTIKDVAVDEGQVNDKVTLQLPAAYYDVTNMRPSHAGENLAMCDTEVTVKCAFRKNDTSRWGVMDAIKKAMIGTYTENFKGIQFTGMKRTEYEDIFVYNITFEGEYYDHAADPEYTLLDTEEITPVLVINKI